VRKPSPEILLLFHAEVGAAMDDELVGLLEGALVEQELDALARRQLALLVLAPLAALAPPPSSAMRVAAFQFSQFLFQIHGRDYNQAPFLTLSRGTPLRVLPRDSAGASACRASEEMT
jgi:hypothetical protein